MLFTASPHSIWIYANELSVGEPLGDFRVVRAAHNMITDGTLALPSPTTGDMPGANEPTNS